MCLIAPADADEPQRQLVNGGTVGLVSGPVGSSDLQLASDLALALNSGYAMRILPIVGEGAIRNVEDLIYLKGVDVSIVQADVLNFFGDNELLPNLGDRIRYIAKIGENEFHVLAGTSFQTIDDLDGRRVNFGVEGSGSFMTAGAVFGDLELDVDVTTYPDSIALLELQEGAIDAMILVDAAPLGLIANLPASSGLHFLSVPADRVRSDYGAARLGNVDYPALIASDQPVDTVAIGEMLAVYNWPADHPRGAQVRQFVTSFFENFDRLTKPPFHPKWKSVDLRESVEGWQRLPYAADLVAPPS